MRQRTSQLLSFLKLSIFFPGKWYQHVLPLAVYEHLIHHAFPGSENIHTDAHTDSDSIKTVGGTQCTMCHFMMLAAFDVE